MIKGKMSDGERLNAIAIALVGGQDNAQQMWDDCSRDFPTSKASKPGELAQSLEDYEKFLNLLPVSKLSIKQVQEAVDPKQNIVVALAYVEDYIEYQKLGGDLAFARNAGNPELTINERVVFLNERENEESMGTAKVGSVEAVKEIVNTALSQVVKLIDGIKSEREESR